LLNAVGGSSLENMTFRGIFVGGLLGFALSFGCASAQTAPSPGPAPSPAASPSPAETPKPVLAAPSPTPAPAASATAAAPPAVAPPPANAALPTPGPAPTSAAAAPGSPIPVEIPPKPKKKAPPPPLPLESALSTDPSPSFQPDTFLATSKAAERYAAIVEAGGWPTDIPALRPGAIGAPVAKLRKRLSIEGDLDRTAPLEGPAAKIWSAELTNAVKRFQGRMGLRKTGIVAGATLKAIDVPAEVRHTQLAASAQRLSQIANFEFGDRYVVVNLPSTSVEAVENGAVAHRYVAIVGDPEHPSPEIAAHISVINLNPTWTVPSSIIKKEIIPKMQRDPGYLTRSKIRILDGAGNEIDPRSVNWNSERAANYILRQDSGAGNSLGSIRIGMPNKLAVYMHDTPSKRLFGADYRFLSHGCVRVQGVYDYAEWLLQGTPGPDGAAWTKAALLAKQKDSERDDIKLTKAVPVIWVYLTGWANGDGVANFRNDVYGVDVAAEASAQADVKDIDTAPAANLSAPAANVSAPAPNFNPLSIFRVR
jgi:murein L,D-transpeptidase YcbB/YkuD